MFNLKPVTEKDFITVEKLARIIFWSQYKDEIYIRELARSSRSGGTPTSSSI